MNEDDSLWYAIDNIASIDTPALAVYPERVRRNIRMLLSMVADPSLLRPHAKTHKSADAARMMIEEGITKFKCATIAEAEMLALAGAADVLLAYQPVGPKVRRLYELTKKYPSTAFSCLVDTEEAARAIASCFHSHDATIPVYLDLNVGMNRTGIAPDAAAGALFRACERLAGLHVAGLHVYDGHIQHADPAERKRAFDAAFEPAARLHALLCREADRPLTLVAGGSPTFPFIAARGNVECSPGTFVYWDKAYATLLADQPFQPAMLVLTRVVSHPAPGLLCLDAGYKAVACEKDMQHRLFFPALPDARLISQSEEHAVVATDLAGTLKEGDAVYAMPYHICPTCAMYERAVVVQHHQADGEWRMMARDRMITV